MLAEAYIADSRANSESAAPSQKNQQAQQAQLQ
jgi:hypothetical protein